MCFIFTSIRPNIQPCPNALLGHTTNVFHPVRTGGLLSANSRVVLEETGEIWDGNVLDSLHKDLDMVGTTLMSHISIKQKTTYHEVDVDQAAVPW